MCIHALPSLYQYGKRSISTAVLMMYTCRFKLSSRSDERLTTYFVLSSCSITLKCSASASAVSSSLVFSSTNKSTSSSWGINKLFRCAPKSVPYAKQGFKSNACKSSMRVLIDATIGSGSWVNLLDNAVPCFVISISLKSSDFRY